jgi:hypothetical protein
MSTGGGNETTKLVATAIGAAVAGAAIGIAAMKLSEPKPKLAYHTPRIATVVFEDKMDVSEKELLMPHNHEEKMRRKIAARALVEEDNFHPRDSVTVRVPATSANMGPGCEYPCRGGSIALTLYTHISVSLTRLALLSLLSYHQIAVDTHFL